MTPCKMPHGRKSSAWNLQLTYEMQIPSKTNFIPSSSRNSPLAFLMVGEPYVLHP